jgi:hypothetical protein
MGDSVQHITNAGENPDVQVALGIDRGKMYVML